MYVEKTSLFRHFHQCSSPPPAPALVLSQLVASRLLGCWHAEVQAGCCEPARAAACWRNMRVNGQLVDGVGIDPSSYELPERGALAFDFVSYVEAGRGSLPRELSGDLMRSPHTLEAQVGASLPSRPRSCDSLPFTFLAIILALALILGSPLPRFCWRRLPTRS